MMSMEPRTCHYSDTDRAMYALCSHLHYKGVAATLFKHSLVVRALYKLSVLNVRFCAGEISFAIIHHRRRERNF